MKIVKLTNDTPHNKFSDLTRELAAASESYYRHGNSPMSDREFDEKVEELRKLENINGFAYDISPTYKVGVDVVSDLKKVTHEYPALSLDKVKYKDRETLVDWMKKHSSGAVISWKLDGSTVILTYDNGRLVSAATRGNGTEGSDITHNARFFRGVPLSIDYKGHLVVRGEAMMTMVEFSHINTEEGGIYENPRNLATATIQMLDSKESRKREIVFKAFELVCPEPDDNATMKYMGDRLSWLEDLGFDVVDHEYTDYEDILSKIEEWKEDIGHILYPTDGLVITYNNLVEGHALGSTGHHPRWAMALKWSDETATTTIRDIEWSVGKTGVITPVAVFDEVRLGLGSNVTRASLHNVSIMRKLGVMRGCKAEVYLANMIIPQISSVERQDEYKLPDYPAFCPVCGDTTQLREVNGIKTLHCINPDCAAQQLGKLINTFSKSGLFIKGLGESQIEDLIEADLVRDPVDFYTLRRRCMVGGTEQAALGKMLMKDGWGSKKWENLLEAIDVSRKTTLQRFLYSLNIPLLGNDLSKKLASYWQNDIACFRSFVWNCDSDPSRNERFEELVAIDGIGEEKASNIVNWCYDLNMDGDRLEAFENLIAELEFADFGKIEESSTLSGLTFVITGVVHQYKNRDEFKASVEARGGKVAGSVSAKTSFLVNNDIESTSGKNKKAKELGIDIISEDDFIARFGK